MPEIKLSFIDFQKNKYVVRDCILEHKNNSECVNCVWTISVVGYNYLENISNIEKQCLLKVYFELDLIGNVVETLVTEYEFIENNEYKPEVLTLNGAILVYCE